jgi:hypothetical protein
MTPRRRAALSSAYFLQSIQATGLAALAAASVGNADWARAAVRSAAMTVPYTGSYGVGLFDGAGQLPTFVVSGLGKAVLDERGRLRSPLACG